MLKDVKQEDLARMIGIARPSLVKFKKDEGDPPFSTLIKISDALKITIEELIFMKPSGISIHHHGAYSNGAYVTQHVSNNDPTLVSLLKELIDHLKTKS